MSVTVDYQVNISNPDLFECSLKTLCLVCATVGEEGLPAFPNGDTQNGISPSLQKPPQILRDSMRLERSKQCLVNFYSRPFVQKQNTNCRQTRYSSIPQPPRPSPKPGEPLNTSYRPELPKSVLNCTKFPNGIYKASLKKGEWVTSTYLMDAYLHLPVHPQSRKILRFRASIYISTWKTG